MCLLIVWIHVDIVTKLFLDCFVYSHSIFGGVSCCGAKEFAVEMEELP